MPNAALTLFYERRSIIINYVSHVPQLPLPGDTKYMCMCICVVSVCELASASIEGRARSSVSCYYIFYMNMRCKHSIFCWLSLCFNPDMSFLNSMSWISFFQDQLFRRCSFNVGLSYIEIINLTAS